MSRSRRREKLPKCSCGRHRLRYADAKQLDPIGNCTILDYVHEHDEQLRKFRHRRQDPLP